MERVLILGTGGTIDDLEYSSESDAPTDRSSIIPKLLSDIHVNDVDIQFEEIVLKDSDFITNDDRNKVLERIQNAPEQKILVTHGTKTMVETAKFLAHKISDKTVVLTGSMTLPSKDNGDDAITELSFALKNISTLPVGVFVSMQGKIFDWDNVRKNTEKGLFEAIK